MEVNLINAISLYYDNQSAIQIADNDIFYKRTKHIENDFDFFMTTGC